jgi:tetratricopeptide (TPR) repeat protein
MHKEDSGEGDVNKNPGIIPLFRKDKQWYLIAATVIILIGVSFYFIFIADRSFTNEQLFARYYAPYPSDVSIRSDDITTDNPITLGFLEYEKSNFSEAANYFNSALAKDNTNIPVRFYLGISCMETGLLSGAEISFKIVIENKFNLFTEQAKWYLSLNYIKSGDDKYHEEIMGLLNSIIENNGDRADEAEEIIKKMKRNNN